jgi:hypothetical protein
VGPDDRGAAVGGLSLGVGESEWQDPDYPPMDSDMTDGEAVRITPSSDGFRYDGWGGGRN